MMHSLENSLYYSFSTFLCEKLEKKRTERSTDRQTDGQHLLIQFPRQRLKWKIGWLGHNQIIIRSDNNNFKKIHFFLEQLEQYQCLAYCAKNSFLPLVITQKANS